MRKGTKTSTAIPRFFFAEPDFNHPSAGCSIHRALYGKEKFFLGGGRKNYLFPRRRTLLANCRKLINDSDFALVPQNDLNKAVLRALRPVPGLHMPIPERLALVPAAISSDEPSPFRRGAQAMANALTRDMFVSVVHEWFDPDLVIVTRDKPQLPSETGEICDSLRDQILKLQTKVPDWLQAVMQSIYKKFPDATTGQVFVAAVQLITNQLKPILSTIQLWTTGFRQWMNPALQPRLKIIRAMLEQKLFLVLTGNLKLDAVDGPVKQQIPTIKVTVGDVIIPVLIGPFDSGPAVIPATGAVGPRGGHIAFVQTNFLNTLGTSDKPYDHEVGHLVVGCVPGFAPEFGGMVRALIDGAYKSGKLKLSSEFTNLGGQKVPTVELLKKVFLNQLHELLADLFGSLIGGSPAFAPAYAYFIGAMTAMALGDMTKVDHIMGNASSYRLIAGPDGTATIVLEPHPQDIVRAGEWQAETAIETDFRDTAKWLRDMVAKESGTPRPKTVVWHGSQSDDGGEDEEHDESGEQAMADRRGRSKRKAGSRGKSKSNPRDGNGSRNLARVKEPELPLVSVTVADYAAVCKLLVPHLLNTPAKCLNGLSLKKLVCLTPVMMERKVNPLKELLKQGIGKLPDSEHHYFFHHITSAATIAFFELVAEGMDPEEALALVNRAAESMMAELLDPWEEQKRNHGIYDIQPEDLQPVCGHVKVDCDESCETNDGKCPGERTKPAPRSSGPGATEPKPETKSPGKKPPRTRSSGSKSAGSKSGKHGGTKGSGTRSRGTPRLRPGPSRRGR
ncbi:MAG: hypothetical protein JST44_24445 [Cyanobacteria bacterium SZAS LIN-5]|nr:hypothetical protein [Cyanobacteria bacterium SZAS LIN-5]